MIDLQAFHGAYPVANIKKAKAFYRDILNCSFGRESSKWVDINFFGHQLVFHQVENYQHKNYFNPVDDKQVPIPHFGVVLNWEDWEPWVRDLRDKEIKFEIGPYLRFEGESGEQKTLFFYDPNGYALEFKSFKNIKTLFES